MPTPVEFMRQYRDIKVNVTIDDPNALVCRTETHRVQLRKYFMMNWKESEELRDYNAVTQGGSKKDAWFQANKDRIRTAAMGKGAPADYALALEWAVYSKKISKINQAALQIYCDEHLGIDCSGFVTNYLIAAGKRAYSRDLLWLTPATDYFTAGQPVNDPTQVRQGDLLVWMTGNSVKNDPGHVAVVESYAPASMVGGNMRVVEATGADGANPKLLDSMYTVEKIIPKGGAVPMILQVKRHGKSGHRVVVRRV
jgi:hypothetical protein